MEDTVGPLISSPLGVATTLFAVCAFYFGLEKLTRWKLFNFFPPLIWIYATPVVLNNLDIIPARSVVYDGLRVFALPTFIVLMLMYVNVPAAIRVMGKGVLVMLLGTVGVVVGGVAAYAIVQFGLEPDAWKAFGTLAGSWIGGTGNMAAAHVMLEGTPEHMGLAVLADNLVYIVWLPILLSSRAFADRFNRWAKVPEGRVKEMEEAAQAELVQTERPPVFQDYLFLGFIAFVVTWICTWLAGLLPDLPVDSASPVITGSTWQILLITTFALGLSVTPARRIPGGNKIAIAIIYLFVASMGAKASLSDLGQAGWFVAGAFIWIFIHGAFILFGAWLFKVDVHSAAIASAANIGGAASAPVVAAYHKESLVPVSILMALIGYALGNYLAWATGQLARLVSVG